jgi:hypothetical protein
MTGIARIALAALAVAACGSRDAGRRNDTGAARDTGGMAGMAGMAGMTMESARMMDEMGPHLRALDGAGADSLRAALPAHRQRVANMIAQMNREMRDMNMAADAAWGATVDSLRQDLTRMPELSPGELAALMPGHRARVERLMASHREMVGRMGR